MVSTCSPQDSTISLVFWPVRCGRERPNLRRYGGSAEVAAVPEPANWLLLSGLMALRGLPITGHMRYDRTSYELSSYGRECSPVPGRSGRGVGTEPSHGHVALRLQGHDPSRPCVFHAFAEQELQGRTVCGEAAKVDALSGR